MPPKKAPVVSPSLLTRVKQVFKPGAPPRGESVTAVSDVSGFGVYHDQFNPDPVLQTTGQGLELYRRMLFDDKIAGTLDLQKRIALSADWEIKPASEKRKDVKIAEFVKQALEDEALEIPIIDVLDNLMDAKPYGFKIAEKIWTSRPMDGRDVWLYKAIKCKPSFDIKFWTDKFGNLEAVYVGEWYGSDPPPKNIQLPMDKIIIFVWPYVQDGNWNGTSVLSALYREWFVKQHVYKFRNVDSQKFGMPTVRAYLNSDNTDEQDEAIKASLDKWPENLVCYIPTEFKEDGTKIPQCEIDFLEKKTAGSPQFNEIIDRLNSAMSHKLLVPDMMGFTEVKNGSRALGETQFNLVLLDAVHTHRRLEDMANVQIIPELVYYNFGENVDLPKWKFLPFEDPAKKAEVLEKMIAAGVIDPTEEWVRPYLQYPERPADIEGAPPEKPAEKPEIPTPPEEGDDDEAPPERQGMAVAGRFDYKQARTWYEEIEEEMAPIVEQALYETAMSMLDRAVSQKVIEEKNWKGINKLEPKGVWRKQLRKALLATETKMYFQGRASGAGDMKRAGVDMAEFRKKTEPLPLPEWTETEKYLDRKWMTDWAAEHGVALTVADRAVVNEIVNYSFKMSGIHSMEVVDSVGKAIYTNINTMMPKEIVALVEQRAGTLSKARAQTIVRNNASEYFNRGRMATFMQAAEVIQGFDYDAIIDQNTTPFCEEQDGRFITSDDPMFVRIQPPNHDNCRSALVPRLKSDPAPTQMWRKSLYPAKRFGG